MPSRLEETLDRIGKSIATRPTPEGWMEVEEYDGSKRLCRVCVFCRSGPVFDGASSSRFADMCNACEEAARWRELCPSRYRKHATLEQLSEGLNPWTDDEISELRAFLDSSTADTLGLVSAPGRRKTTAAFAVVREMLAADWHTVIYATATEMLLDLQARQFEPDALERYTGPDVLLLDELGDRDGGLTDFQRQQLHLVLEKRYRDEKKLIWTSNLPLKELKSWCAERTWERLWDRAIVLQVGGKTTRQLAA